MKKTTAIGIAVLLIASGLTIFTVQSSHPPDEEPLPAYQSTASLVYKFAVASDGHVGYSPNPNGEREDVLHAAIDNEGGIQRLFELGDTVHDSQAYYATLKTKLDLFGIPYHLAMGNHDVWWAMSGTFSMDSPYYNVTSGDIVWIVLNATTTGALYSTTQDYLDDALSYYSTKLIFIMCHVPRAKFANQVNEADDTTFQASVEAHADHIGGVFAGHIHNKNLMTYQLNSIRYSYPGTYMLSADGSSWGHTSYMIVEVWKDGSTFTVKLWDENPDTNEVVYGTTAQYSPVDNGDSPVWNAAADDALASVAGNWLNGVPTAGEVAYFKSTSTKNCVWDINVNCSLYVDNDYTGKINQSVSTTFYDVKLYGGTYTPLSTKYTVIAGNAWMYGTRITTAVLRVNLTGDYKNWSFPLNDPSMLWIGVYGNIKLNSSVYVAAAGTGASITGTLVIKPEQRFCVYPCQNLAISGTVTGLGSGLTRGQLRVDCGAGTKTLMAYTGNLNCNYRFQTGTTNKFALSGPLTVNGMIIIRRDSDVSGSQVATLNTSGYAINCEGMYIWVGGLLDGGYTSNMYCYGDWNSANGTFSKGNSNVYMTKSDSLAVLRTGASFNNLYLANTNIRLVTNAAQTVRFNLSSMTFGFTGMTQRVNLTFTKYPTSPWGTPGDIVLTWSQSANLSAEAITVTLSNLPSSLSYRLYQNGVRYATHDAGTTSFAFALYGAHDYELRISMGSQILTFVDLTFLMLAIGLVIGVLGFTVHQARTAKRMDGPMVVRAIVIIFVGLTLITAAYAII